MKKITMAQFMYHLLKEAKEQMLFISHIKYAVGYVAKEANVMLTDTFDTTLECVLEPVAKYPNTFQVKDRMSSIILKSDSKFKVEDIDKDTKNAIKACLEHIGDPIYYAGIDVDFAIEKEEDICKSTKMMEFFAYMVWKGKTIATSCTSNLNCEALAHLSRLPNLYNLLSRYYSKNLMDKNNGRDEESFFVSYREKEEDFYFEVIKTTEVIGKDVFYKVIPVSKPEKFVYFPDLALNITDRLYHEKEDKLKDVKKVLREAFRLNIPYYIISDFLEGIYGHKEDNE